MKTTVPPWTREDFRGVWTMARVCNRAFQKSRREIRRETPKAGEVLSKLRRRQILGYKLVLMAIGRHLLELRAKQ